MESLRELQEQDEHEHDTAASIAKLEAMQKEALEGSTELPRASAIIARIFGAVRASLEKEASTSTPGLGAKYKGWLRKLSMDVAAIIAIRECVARCSSLTHSRPIIMQDLSLDIGKMYELEVRIRDAEIVNPMYMQKIHDQIKDRCTTSRQHIRKVYNVAYERVMKGAIDSTLPKSDYMLLGRFGVQACVDAGLIYSTRGTGAGGTVVRFHLSEDIQEFIHGYTQQDVRSIIDREAGAMRCPPDAWTTLMDGGYLTLRRKSVQPLMDLRRIRKAERQRLSKEFTAENMPKVFECGNYLQSQAFALHMPTMAAIQRVWGEGGGVLGVPSKNGPVRPECPLPEEWRSAEGTEAELDVFQKWKLQCVLYYEALRTWRGRVRECGGFLRIAAKVKGPVWFPVYFDKRGRWYYRGSPNPQGSDLSKGVLHFNEKKALGHEGLYWLKVHIANSYGFDKDRFDDRARWTEQNWDTIQNALDVPEDHPDVWGTDAPWCMYAAAWELRAAYQSGNPLTYCTGIPIHMDATCSGLQHFSAVLRDPVGAQYVNLNDEAQCGPKQDIYARVALNAMAAIQRDLEDSEETVQDMAKFWLETGLPRSLAKKPVMTFVYGATLRGTAEHIECYVSTEMHHIKWPENIKARDLCTYAAKKLFKGIAATVPAAASAMRWLRSVAVQQPKGQRMEWTVPTGFRVQHDYQDFDEVRINIKSCGLTKIVVRNINDSTRPAQMQNAIAPNFVHALDAAHLTLTANAMGRAGLSMVAIHDSFGTHAADVPKMHACIREEFVSLYSNRNILGEFLWDVKGIGEPPPKGTLEIKQVLDSEFFFC